MKLKQNVIMRKVAGEYIFVPVKSGDDMYEGIITADSTGAFILEKLQNEITREELLDAICENFDVERNIAQEDLDEVLASLNEKELLI